MSSIAYVSRNYRNEPEIYTNSVQGFRGYHDKDEDRPLVRRRDWWSASRSAKVCKRLLTKKFLILNEVKR